MNRLFQCMFNNLDIMQTQQGRENTLHFGSLGLNSIYFETIEKQNKYYTIQVLYKYCLSIA